MSVIHPSLASVIQSLEDSAEAKQKEIQGTITYKKAKDEHGVEKKTSDGQPEYELDASGNKVPDETKQGQIDLQLFNVAEALDKNISDLLAKTVKSQDDTVRGILQEF
jgi:hypothetical protein